MSAPGGAYGSGSPSAFTSPGLPPQLLAMLLGMQNGGVAPAGAPQLPAPMQKPAGMPLPAPLPVTPPQQQSTLSQLSGGLGNLLKGLGANSGTGASGPGVPNAPASGYGGGGPNGANWINGLLGQQMIAPSIFGPNDFGGGGY